MPAREPVTVQCGVEAIEPLVGNPLDRRPDLIARSADEAVLEARDERREGPFGRHDGDDGLVPVDVVVDFGSHVVGRGVLDDEEVGGPEVRHTDRVLHQSEVCVAGGVDPLVGDDPGDPVVALADMGEPGVDAVAADLAESLEDGRSPVLIVVHELAEDGGGQRVGLLAAGDDGPEPRVVEAVGGDTRLILGETVDVPHGAQVDVADADHAVGEADGPALATLEEDPVETLEGRLRAPGGLGGAGDDGRPVIDGAEVAKIEDVGKPPAGDDPGGLEGVVGAAGVEHDVVVGWIDEPGKGAREPLAVHVVRYQGHGRIVDVEADGVDPLRHLGGQLLGCVLAQEPLPGEAEHGHGMPIGDELRGEAHHPDRGDLGVGGEIRGYNEYAHGLPPSLLEGEDDRLAQKQVGARGDPVDHAARRDERHLAELDRAVVETIEVDAHEGPSFGKGPGNVEHLPEILRTLDILSNESVLRISERLFVPVVVEIRHAKPRRPVAEELGIERLAVVAIDLVVVDVAAGILHVLLGEDLGHDVLILQLHHLAVGVVLAHPGVDLGLRVGEVQLRLIVDDDVVSRAVVALEGEPAGQRIEVDLVEGVPYADHWNDVLLADLLGDPLAGAHLVDEASPEIGSPVELEPLHLLVEGPGVGEVELPSRSALEEPLELGSAFRHRHTRVELLPPPHAGELPDLVMRRPRALGDIGGPVRADARRQALKISADCQGLFLLRRASAVRGLDPVPFIFEQPLRVGEPLQHGAELLPEKLLALVVHLRERLLLRALDVEEGGLAAPDHVAAEPRAHCHKPEPDVVVRRGDLHEQRLVRHLGGQWRGRVKCATDPRQLMEVGGERVHVITAGRSAPLTSVPVELRRPVTVHGAGVRKVGSVELLRPMRPVVDVVVGRDDRSARVLLQRGNELLVGADVGAPAYGQAVALKREKALGEVPLPARVLLPCEPQHERVGLARLHEERLDHEVYGRGARGEGRQRDDEGGLAGLFHEPGVRVPRADAGPPEPMDGGHEGREGSVPRPFGGGPHANAAHRPDMLRDRQDDPYLPNSPAMSVDAKSRRGSLTGPPVFWLL